ncbi:hypothetical protein GGX14DRAFT_504769 [Mycena pura]|uniref:DUF6593 domain-containing protein n=1 Tax=Mycena pura TaxID=153505 RepID=A0AAD6UWS9_9AGAR|nr:hypothetical protein GGX14DRAFT_504769 [Mycena pura]
MNPYAQGGWTNVHNPNAVVDQGRGARPSLYGVVPYVTPPSVVGTFLTFTFLPVDGAQSILNAIVRGPKSHTYFTVDTNPSLSSSGNESTVLQNHKHETAARIEWCRRSCPTVEVRDVVEPRKASEWLELSSDRTHRIMHVRGRSFRWAPGKGSIELYNLNSDVNSIPRLFGRISKSTPDGTVKLEMTTEAAHVGLMEACVTATLLLMSDRNIDKVELSRDATRAALGVKGGRTEFKGSDSGLGLAGDEGLELMPRAEKRPWLRRIR